MQIILIEPDKRLRDILSMNLCQSLRAEVISKEDGKSAWGMVELLEPSLIVSKDNVEDEDTVDYLLSKLPELQSPPPLISLGTEVNNNSPQLILLPETASPELIIKTATEAIKRKDQQKVEGDSSEEIYSPVPINVFRYFAELPFDIFIRLKRGEQFQYLKRIKAGDGYDLSLIDGYQEKGVEAFYVLDKHHEKFTDMVNNRFRSLLKDVQTHSKSKEEIQEFVLEQLTDSGFNDSNLQLAQESISKINEKINKTDSKLGLLTEVYNSQLGYRYRRSYMISIIGSIMLKSIPWGESKFSEYITMAAYLHDMYLEDEVEMMISSDFELERALLGSERKRVEEHAKLAADKIKTIDRIPSEVEKIVRQHHGSHTGIGYPNNISNQIQKLSYLFLVAEEFSTRILSSPRTKISISGVLKDIERKFESSDEVPKYLQAIRESLKKK